MRITGKVSISIRNLRVVEALRFFAQIDGTPRITAPCTGIETYREGKKSPSRRTVSMVFLGYRHTV